MNYSYKSDIIEKVFQFIAIVYFVFGLLMNYAWACKELDFITDVYDILRFWEPIAGVSGVLSTAHVILIVHCICIGKKASPDPNNMDINVLFYVLSVPLFIVTVVYMIMLIVRDIIIVKMIGYFTVFMRFGHLALFCGTMIFIVLFNIKKPIISTLNSKLLIRFVRLITILEMVVYFMFHMISQQVHSFISVSSVNSTYSHYYNSSIVNRTGDPFKFNSIQNYLQPLVILFCCVCAIYLIIMSSLNDENESNPEIEKESRRVLVNLLGFEPSTHSESTDKNDSVNRHIFQSLRLPPLSLVLGILLVTVFLLVIVIVDGFISAKSFQNSRMISSIFLIVIYLLSMILMSIQINEMKRWQIMKENKNVVNKILIWVGILGQLIVSMEMIKVNFYDYNDIASGYEILEFFILTFQALMQYIVLSLALDQKWIPPDIKTWQEYISPAVGLLSINLGLLAFSIFNAMKNNTNQKDTFLFLKLFSMGIQSLGATLLILQRLHVSLIFGQMVIVTNSLMN